MNKGSDTLGSPCPREAAATDRFLAFYESVQSLFEQAAERQGKSIDRFFRMAGQQVKLRFAGSPGLVSLARALEHLAAAASLESDLSICLFDSAGSGLRLPPPPWSWDSITGRGDIGVTAGSPVAAAFQAGAGILSLFDRERGRALYWIDDAKRLPFHEMAAPLRTILHWFMAGSARQLIHGAAVGNAAGGVLVGGRGGTGKSTVALACLAAGMDYAGDDCVLVQRSPEPRVHGMYATAMLHPGQIARFPQLRPAVAAADSGGWKKVMLYLQTAFSSRLSAGFPLRAILLPRFSGHSRTVMKTTTPAELFSAMAASTIAVLPGAGENDFRSIGAIIRQVPNFIIETGTDMERIGRTVAGLLEGRC
jgi:hypothetical protein